MALLYEKITYKLIELTKLIEKIDDHNSLEYHPLTYAFFSRLSPTLYSTLHHNDIRSIEQILLMTQADLIRLTGVGRKALEEIKIILGDFGLSLKK